ncbi:helix-turn-helix domain-containing protein [Methylobacterium iners]|uniref:HTH cro/C1-type domain-containing protein n=1 Tax=Methylobacterium iners TaxID=418707 RepID=A0ABQ4RTZ0_9HYPH|nr:helix-turn-helix transcriptional regulator [Methylobacterium iners]GJD93138.1 hypothetical protein OCOJLMKI_0328 [Methylobacterium iners]
MGLIVRRLRGALGLSQEALEVDAGLDRGYVGRIERATENSFMDALDQLAAALRVTSAELLREPVRGEGPPPTSRSDRKVGR